VEIVKQDQGALFDYEALDTESRIVLKQRASEIKTLAKRVASDIVEIGGKLVEVKDRLGGNGRFNAWLESELGWSERTAYNFIAVFTKFGAANFAIENVAPSALYLLVAPATPEPARKAAIEMANQGERVTHKVAKAIVASAKDAEPKTEEMFEVPVEEDGPAPLTEEENKEERQREAAWKDVQPEKPQPPAKETSKPAPLPIISNTLRFLNESQIQLNVRLMPADGDSRGRQAIVAISANDGQPAISSCRLPDRAELWPGPIGATLSAFVEKEASKTPAKKAPKSTAKVAKKSSKRK
jgi:hypothetical protein